MWETLFVEGYDHNLDDVTYPIPSFVIDLVLVFIIILCSLKLRSIIIKAKKEKKELPVEILLLGFIILFCVYLVLSGIYINLFTDHDLKEKIYMDNYNNYINRIEKQDYDRIVEGIGKITYKSNNIYTTYIIQIDNEEFCVANFHPSIWKDEFIDNALYRVHLIYAPEVFSNDDPYGVVRVDIWKEER